MAKMDESWDKQPASGTSDAAGATPPALDCWYLTGPTASGKTAIGLEMARLLNAEIVSLDSMAIYRGMDIGTDKPTPEQQAEVPHHLIDIRNPDEDFSVSEYVDAAHGLINRIRGSGREVLFVGGTPMYLTAMLRGIYRGPPADWEFRKQVQEEVAQVGIAALHERLNLVDPLAASRLHPNDVRRIIRALEVFKITGRPISHQQMQFEEGNRAEECRVFVLRWPRPALYARIDARVERMFESGLVDEVQRLLDRYGTFSRTASQAVGYRETMNYLEGRLSRAETIQRVQTRTHRFARRQETWFRSLSECRTIDHSDQRTASEVAQALVAAGNKLR